MHSRTHVHYYYSSIRTNSLYFRLFYFHWAIFISEHDIIRCASHNLCLCIACIVRVFLWSLSALLLPFIRPAWGRQWLNTKEPTSWMKAHKWVRQRREGDTEIEKEMLWHAVVFRRSPCYVIFGLSYWCIDVIMHRACIICIHSVLLHRSPHCPPLALIYHTILLPVCGLCVFMFIKCEELLKDNTEILICRRNGMSYAKNETRNWLALCVQKERERERKSERDQREVFNP